MLTRVSLKKLVFGCVIVMLLGLQVAGAEDVSLSKAEKLFVKGEFVRALVKVNVSIKKAPSAGAYFLRGNIFRVMGNLDRAVKDYTRAIKANPGMVFAQAELLYCERS